MLVQQRIRQQSLAEELRVLYVAMTRAKEHLILVGTAEETNPEKWTSRWANHEGPMPTEMILGATTMLDWLGPVYAATGADGGNVISLTAVSPDEAFALRDPSKSDFGSRRVPEQFARLVPLDPPPAPNPEAEEVISRLTREYPFRRLTHIPASLAATAGTLHADPAYDAPFERVETPQHAGLDARSLPMPAFIAGAIPATSSDIGTIVHLVFEHVVYTGACTEDDFEQQVEALVSRNILTVEQAACVDVFAIAWFASSELGIRIRKNHGRLLREIPLYLSRDPATVDPEVTAVQGADHIMIRGRIDALLNLPSGAILIDYKTDRVTPAEAPIRAKAYQEQLETYASALVQMTEKPVAEIWLVFLAARTLVRLP